MKLNSVQGYIYNLLVIGKTVNTNVVYSGTTEMKLEIVSTIIKRKLVQNVLHFMKNIQQNSYLEQFFDMATEVANCMSVCQFACTKYPLFVFT